MRKPRLRDLPKIMSRASEKNNNNNTDIDCMLHMSQARCQAPNSVYSLISHHTVAGIILIIPILQMWKRRFGEVKVTSLWSQSEKAAEVRFEPRTSGSVLFTLMLDQQWRICTIISQFQSPALHSTARPLLDHLLPPVKHAHVPSFQLPWQD